MTTLSMPIGERGSPALWSMAFRPFFLAASLWSALALTLWIGLYLTGAALPSRFDPLSWHIHAMLFGFVLAAIAGFMFTAIPNWTGRAPIRGPILQLLVGLWLLGRAACLFSTFMPAWLAAAIDLAFPLCLCVLAAREIVAAHNWRNLAMPLPIALLTLADLLMFLEAAGFDIAPGLGWRLALAAIIVLISVIGGRIIPAFTRNWLTGRGRAALPAVPGAIDRAALGTLHAGLIGWAIFPTEKAIGAVLLLAGALMLWRLARWRGLSTGAEPLLAILHLGYAWIAAGALLLGLSMLSPQVPEVAAVHALTAGAIGTMILAVMTRVSRGHTGRPLQADWLTILIYLLITAAAVTRVAAPFAASVSLDLLTISAVLWIASFALFAIGYAPMLVSPRTG